MSDQPAGVPAVPPLPPAPTSAPKRARRDWGALLTRVAIALVQRMYALALIAIILWLSFLAFWYLLDSLLFSPGSPRQITDLPALRETELSRSSSAFAGVQATENPRAALSHYHRFGAWFQPDSFNDCTRSGCHGALPHHKNKESRAFLNLHATSMHCGVCHMESDPKPLELVWYDLSTGQASAAPAAMRALAWLEADAERRSPAHTDAERSEIVDLLETANRESHARDMSAVIRHLRAVRSDSPDFRAFLDAARHVIPQHLRGEYGVKLALKDDFGGPLLAHPRSEKAIEQFLTQEATLSEVDRKALLGKVHTLRDAEKRNCTDCHTSDSSLIHFAGMGYPKSRMEALTKPLLMQAIENIMKGEPFHLPGFVGAAKEAGNP